MKNIEYKTDNIKKYFSKNRICWDDFYESERQIIENLRINEGHNVLDIGCGCGGLGLALSERFNLVNYSGVEINQLAALEAKNINSDAKIYVGDFLDVSKNELLNKKFDFVFSLSCFDWNIEFSKMLHTAWSHVIDGGSLVATFRLVMDEGCKDFEISYQYINYEGNKEGERAPYIVLNAKELFQELILLKPLEISAYGYYGEPSVSAETPYNKICFCAVSIKKNNENQAHGPLLYLDLPEDIVSNLNFHK